MHNLIGLLKEFLKSSLIVATYLLSKRMIIEVVLLILVLLIIIDIALVLRLLRTLRGGVLVAAVPCPGRRLRVHHVVLSMSAANLLDLALPDAIVWHCLLLLQVLLLRLHRLKRRPHLPLIDWQLVSIKLVAVSLLGDGLILHQLGLLSGRSRVLGRLTRLRGPDNRLLLLAGG